MLGIISTQRRTSVEDARHHCRVHYRDHSNLGYCGRMPAEDGQSPQKQMTIALTNVTVRDGKEPPYDASLVRTDPEFTR